MTSGTPRLPLIPYPAHVEDGTDMPLSAASRITAPSAASSEAELLASAVARRTGLACAVALDAEPQPGDIALLLEPDHAREAYALETDTHTAIRASTPAGLFLGSQTLLQLLTVDGDSWLVRGATIADEPRFRYRGVMLDVARHFFSVADVRHYIDLVSTLKINVLHLHLADDQGWRLEITGWPALTERAASTSALGDPGGFFTQEDYRHLVAYAAQRHITVVPEIDTPGHTHAVTVAYPEFAAPSVVTSDMIQQASDLGQDLPVFGETYGGWLVGFSSLKIADPATDAFVADVFAQLAALTPGPWIHLGGDEALGTPAEDFATFVRTTAHAIADTGKTPIAWHEAGRVRDLPAGTVGQYWGYRTPQPGFAEEARAFVDGGGALILSPSDAAYLDMTYDTDFPIGLSWADGPTSPSRSYDWDPAAVIPGVGDADILGVEAPMWTESIRTIADVEAMAFPRLAGIADIAWSPRNGAERSWASARERLAAQTAAWDAEGVRFHRADDIPWSEA